MEKANYENSENWLSLPEIENRVDTFYLYPSAYKNSSDRYIPFCKLDDENMRRIARICFQHQGRAFEKHTNVFAPFYRQMDPSYGIKMIKNGNYKNIQKLWARDVIDSFKYYLDNFNNGRPFILAGHSQGSRMAMILLSTFLKENPLTYEKMIATYAVGETISEEFLRENCHLKFAQGEEDIGVVISWNTEHKGVTFNNPVIFSEALVINPLNWKTDETYGGKELNLGAKLKNGDIVPNSFDCIIDKKRGTVQCSTANIDEYRAKLKIFPRGCYHEMDYNFYYSNIEENVGKRIDRYFKLKNRNI